MFSLDGSGLRGGLLSFDIGFGFLDLWAFHAKFMFLSPIHLYYCTLDYHDAPSHSFTDKYTTRLTRIILE